MDITLTQGDDLRVLVEVRDQSGQLVDISGAQSIKYAVAQGFGQAVLIFKELQDGIVVTNANTFYFDITAQDSGSLDVGSYVQEVEILTSGGLTYTVLSGRIRITPQLIKEV